MKRFFLPLAAALVMIPVASASVPPARSVLVSPTAIDGNQIGGKATGFTTTVKADINNADTSNQIVLEWDAKKNDGRTKWASQTRNNNGENNFVAYYAAFHTAKGDRSGTTTLAVFLRHWHGGKVIKASPIVGSYTSWNVVFRTGITKAIFMFDKNKRLAGVALYLANDPVNQMERYCTLPACAGTR